MSAAPPTAPIQSPRAPSQPPPSPALPSARSPRWLFRVCALVLAPLLTLAVLEGGLRLAGYGYPTAFFLRSQADGRPTLIENEKYGWRFFGPALARAPRPVAIPADKPPGSYRVFVLGESAAYGDPQPDFGLPRMIEALLRARWPGTRFEVVNAAMTAINSHVILPIARDCARANGDLWVIYMGNNEVVGPFGSGTVFGRQAPPLPVVRASLALRRTRIGQLLTDLPQFGKGRKAASTEWQGMRMFQQHQVRPDDPRMATVYAHFERNLADILDIGRDRGIKMVVSTVVSNLKDCAPFASVNRPGLTPAQTAEWSRFYQAGVEAEQADKPADAIAAFRQAEPIDGQYADLQFRWGRCCLALGDAAEARRRFALARDADALRFRADSRINDIIRQIARNRDREGIRLVDAEEELAHQSPHGLPGQELLYEHVHLNFEGNYRLARAIAEQVSNLLPETVPHRGDAPPAWLSVHECAARLAWTDWNRYEVAESMMQRATEPPFTGQLGHAERSRRLQQELETLLPAVRPPALREAADQYHRALTLAPDDWVLHNNLARLRNRLGDLDRAAESCREVIRLLPHSIDPRLQLGVLLTQLGRFDEAIGQFDAALSLKPRLAPAIAGRALALARQGHHDAAILEYERALQLDPDSGEAHLNLGMELSAQGKTDEARRHFRQALGRRLLKADALLNLGKMCYSQGWVLEAITNFTDALRIEPTHATAHFCLGGALAATGRRSEAQEHFAEAVRLDPSLGEAHLGLGIELGRQGQDGQALGHFAEAVRLRPDLVEARINLGIALRRQQRGAEALLEFQEALRLAPTNAIARKHLEALQARRTAE